MELAFLTADFVNGSIDEADGVELVKSEGGIREVLANAADESGRHIDADLGNGFGITVMSAEVLGEGRDGASVLAGCNEEHFALLKIDEEGDVVVATAGGGLINADLGDRRI